MTPHHMTPEQLHRFRNELSRLYNDANSKATLADTEFEFRMFYRTAATAYRNVNTLLVNILMGHSKESGDQ